MKKQKSIFQFFLKTTCVLFLMSCFCSAVQAESILFTASFTNNTGGDLNFVGYNAHPEYKIIQHLPFGTWKNGETRIIAFEVETGPIAEAIFYTFEGEITTLTYNYTGSLASGSGTYPLRFSFIPGKTAESSHLMIFDPGRAKDYDGLDVCKGGNKNGAPFYCVANNLPVSIHNGDVASTYLTYDKDPSHSYPAPHLEGEEEIFLLPQVEMQLLAKDDTTMSLMTWDFPFKGGDITLEKTDVADPEGNRIPFARTWFFDPNNKKIHNGGYGNYLDMCLGAPHLHGVQRLVLDKCDSLKIHDWVLNSNGMISNKIFCLTRELDAGTGKMVIVRRECKEDRTYQRWVLKPVHKVEDTHTIRPLSAAYDGKCLDNNNNIFLTDLAMVKLNDCGNTLTQSWVFNEDNKIEYAYGPGLCLGHIANWEKDATPIKLYECEKPETQRWIYDGLTKQMKFFPTLEKCAGIGKDTEMKLYGCVEGQESQQWEIDTENPVDLGDFKVATIHSMLDPTKCIDNRGGQIVDGNPIQLSNCVENDNKNNQMWFFEGYNIRLSEDRSKCLDLKAKNNGTPLQLYYCHATDHGAESHEWVYDGLTQTIRFKKYLDKCLSLPNNDTESRNTLVIEDCKPALDRMKWALKQATPNPNDAIFGEIKPANDPERCINLESSNASNGANIQSVGCDGSQAQAWFIKDRKIRLAKDLGYCFEPFSLNDPKGTNIQLLGCSDKPDDQDWIFDVSFQLIRSRLYPNKCIYVYDYNNVKLTTCDYDNPSNMQWILPGNYSERLNGEHLNIHLAKDEGKCIDMKENKEDGNLRVWDCEENNSQYFVFEGPRIRRNDSNLCVDIHTTDSGENIRLWPCNDVGINTRGQAWFYDAVSGRIHSNADPTKCMRFDSGQAKNFANIKLGNCDDSIAEIFVIK